jgi:hypothetical protein
MEQKPPNKKQMAFILTDMIKNGEVEMRWSDEANDFVFINKENLADFDKKQGEPYG